MLTKLFRDPSHGNPRKKLYDYGFTGKLKGEETWIYWLSPFAIKANVAQLSKPQSTLD